MNSGFANNNLFAMKNSVKNMNISFELSEYDKFNVVDMEIFDMIKIQTENDSSIIREIYLSYFSEAEVLIKLINEYFNKKKYEKLKVSLHTLSGISATVGALKLREVIKDTEYALILQEYMKVSWLIPVLNLSYHEFKRSINQMI